MTNNDRFFMAQEKVLEARQKLDGLAAAALTLGFTDLGLSLREIEISLGSSAVEMRRAFVAEMQGKQA